MMEGVLRVCRHCNTAYHEGFPRVNCQCGRNEAAPESAPQPTPAGDYPPSDPDDYDMAPSTTHDADRANRQQGVPLDDSLSWWT